MSRFPKSAIIDTCFWYALYNNSDGNHKIAQEKSCLLQTMNILLPWPCLYETINTRFAKNMITLKQFELFLKQPHVIRIEDEPYREDALEAAFRTSLIESRPIALVDMVIRLIIEDNKIKKDALLTFNRRDFSDVCRKHKIEIL